MASTQLKEYNDAEPHSPPNYSGGEEGGISPKKRRKVNHGKPYV